MHLLALLGCRAPATPVVTAPPPDGAPSAVDLLDTEGMDPRFAEIATWAAEQIDLWHVPGAAIAVVEDGELRHLTGLGVRRWGEPELVTPDTVFRVGSVSKLFDGAVVAEQVARGNLDLDAPASVVLGDLTLASGTFDDFTLNDLVGHSSGMQTIGVPRTCDTDPDGLGEALAELTPEWALWTPPGELFNYANQGYGLLGLAAERASGERYVDLAQGLFDAAGMTSTTLDWEVGTSWEHATGHTVDRDTGEPVEFHGFEERACIVSYPSGGVMSTARDLGHALEVLLAQGDGWMSPEAWEIYTTRGWDRSETSGYGFGLSTGDYGGYPTYSHHGSVGGFYAMVQLIPSEGLGVVVLVNASHVVTDPPEPGSKPTHRIMRYTLDAFLGTDEYEMESTVRPVEEWDRFVGDFHSDFDLGDVAVALDGDTLWYTELDDDLQVPLLPYSRNSFQYLEPGSDDDYPAVSFVSGEDGEVKWLLTGTGAAQVQGR